jgi:hypothetical protein
MTRPDEADLREDFARLRDAHRRGAPSFAAVLATRPTRRRWGARSFIVLSLAAATVVVMVVRERSESRARNAASAMLRSARWTAPTDFLLDVPGGWLLRDLPRVASPATRPIDNIPVPRTSS